MNKILIAAGSLLLGIMLMTPVFAADIPANNGATCPDHYISAADFANATSDTSKFTIIGTLPATADIVDVSGHHLKDAVALLDETLPDNLAGFIDLEKSSGTEYNIPFTSDGCVAVWGIIVKFPPAVQAQ